MNIKLKICGMREPSNILEVAGLQPEYMGFIFYKKSPRCVPADFKIPSGFPVTVKSVGVFVDEEPEQIINLVHQHQLDFAQLHGNESVAFCEKLKDRDIGVIKVFSVEDRFDFKATKAYSDVVDYFLFDTKGKYHGGNGQTFDWNLLQRYDQEPPFFLSGGLSVDNIFSLSALKNLNLHAIDLNSGVETAVGLKNRERIANLRLKIEKLKIY
jgi:phosphoribosylanthranilate isomerase